jgi:integrase
MPLVELTRERLQAAMAALGQQYASTTLTNLRTALNKALVRAVEDGVLARNPLVKVRVPKPIRRPKRMISLAQRDAMLAECERRGRDLHLASALMLLAGLRRREALAVRWERDVDLEHRVLSVSNDEDFTSKSGAAVRRIPISAELFPILARYHQPNGFVVAPDRPYGGRYRYDFTRSFASAASAAGVEWLHPHLCRHVFSSFFVENGGSLFRLSRILGHSTAAVTEEYLHLVPSHGEDEVPQPERHPIPA